MLTSLIEKIQTIGADEGDGETERLHKRMFVSAIFLVMIATTLWGIIYIVFHEPVAGAASISYAIFTLISLLIIQQTHQVRFLIYCQLAIGMVLPFFHTFVLGGFAASSVVAVWSLMSPLAAIFYLKPKQALACWAVYLLLLVAVALLQPFVSLGNHLPQALVTVFFVLNIGSVTSIALAMLNTFKQQRNEAYRLLRIEQEKGENLLLNILPKEIAAILKNESRTIADSFEGASILFADLVGFTPLSAKLAPVEMVNLLNQIFSYFDGLVEKYDLEKIRTIGDNYMVASGVPRARPDHASALARMAVEMRDYICTLTPVDGRNIQFRIGINSGPVVGGVIGRKKFVYDLWGDAVNVASRMESHGEAGRIQITQDTYELVRRDFICEPRGVVEIKGRGMMKTWFLVGLKPGKSEK